MTKSAFVPCHTDEDNSLGTVSVHCAHDLGGKEYKKNLKVLAYFVFPTMGIAVPLHSGDVLIFNATIPHCLSSPTMDYIHRETYGIAMYLGCDIVSLHDNKKK